VTCRGPAPLPLRPWSRAPVAGPTGWSWPAAPALPGHRRPGRRPVAVPWSH